MRRTSSKDKRPNSDSKLTQNKAVLPEPPSAHLQCGDTPPLHLFGMIPSWIIEQLQADKLEIKGRHSYKFVRNGMIHSGEFEYSTRGTVWRHTLLWAWQRRHYIGQLFEWIKRLRLLLD